MVTCCQRAIIIMGKTNATVFCFLTLLSHKHMIKLGSNVKSKIHDDLTGHVVVYQPLNNYAVVMKIMDYEMMTLSASYLTWS